MSPSIIASFIYCKSFSTGTLCNKVNWKIVNGETNIYINRFGVVAIVYWRKKMSFQNKASSTFLKEITFKLQRLSQMYKAYLRFSLIKYQKSTPLHNNTYKLSTIVNVLLSDFGYIFIRNHSTVARVFIA